MRIFVKAKPGAKKAEVIKIGDDRFEVSVKEPPVKGLANRAITDLLAGHFGVSSSEVRIVSGLTSRQKIIEIGK